MLKHAGSAMSIYHLVIIFQVNTEMHNSRKAFMNVKTKNSPHSFITANITFHLEFFSTSLTVVLGFASPKMPYRCPY
jgi:hypothetical protein